MRVKILWAEYDLTYVKKLLDEDGSHCFGTCDNANQRIAIEELEGEDRKRATLFHELIHAISYMHGLGLSEDQTRGLEHGFYTVLKENPGLIELLRPPDNLEKLGMQYTAEVAGGAA